MNSIRRVLIADDHPIVREGLQAMLAGEQGLEVVGEADNGKDALHQVGALNPDVVLMDLSMPNTNGTEAIKSIKRRYPTVKVIVLTVHKTEEYVHATLEAGADGYVLKEDCHADLLIALRSVKFGKIYLSPSVCDRVVNGFLKRSPGTERQASWEKLTHREREVIKLIAEGYKNKDIAHYLTLSPKTVEKHRSNLMKKLGLHNASAVTAYAIENGLITQQGGARI